MRIAALITRPVTTPQVKSFARVAPRALPFYRPRPRVCGPVQAALQDPSVFESARRELTRQVARADNAEQLKLALGLRKALRQYLALEDTLAAQDTSPDKVRAALVRVLDMVQEHHTKLPADTKTQVWQALILAGKLRGVELQQTRQVTLPPRLPTPYAPPPVWDTFSRHLKGMRHKAWPPAVTAWYETLLVAMDAYLVAEGRFATAAPTVIAVADLQALVADALDKINPPAPAKQLDALLRVQLNWREEHDKRSLGDAIAWCRCALLLRQDELATLAALLAPR